MRIQNRNQGGISRRKTNRNPNPNKIHSSIAHILVESLQSSYSLQAACTSPSQHPFLENVHCLHSPPFNPTPVSSAILIRTFRK